MKPDNYLELDFKDITSSQLESGSAGGFALPATNRREFVKRLGGGIVILISLGDLEAAQAPGRQRGGGRPGGLPTDFNAFLRIGEDGRVTCFTGKIEMGQGVITSLAQMLAEELEAPLNSVEMVMGDTDLCPWDMGTFGSMSTRFFGSPLRAAAAEAKAVLLELAAESLKVPLAQLTAKDGVIIDQKNEQHRVTYGQLAKGQKIERHMQSKPAVEDVVESRSGAFSD